MTPREFEASNAEARVEAIREAARNYLVNPIDAHLLHVQADVYQGTPWGHKEGSPEVSMFAITISPYSNRALVGRGTHQELDRAVEEALGTLRNACVTMSVDVMQLADNIVLHNEKKTRI